MAALGRAICRRRCCCRWCCCSRRWWCWLGFAPPAVACAEGSDAMRLASLPRHPLATLPTPLHRARGLEQVLGARAPRIYFKRDDLTGFAFGGNKARKLEYLLADALAAGATTLV